MEHTTGTLKAGPYKDNHLIMKTLKTKFQILSEMFDPLEFSTPILTAGHLTLITFHQLACRKAVLQAE